MEWKPGRNGLSALREGMARRPLHHTPIYRGGVANLCQQCQLAEAAGNRSVRVDCVDGICWVAVLPIEVEYLLWHRLTILSSKHLVVEGWQGRHRERLCTRVRIAIHLGLHALEDHGYIIQSLLQCSFQRMCHRHAVYIRQCTHSCPQAFSIHGVVVQWGPSTVRRRQRLPKIMRAHVVEAGEHIGLVAAMAGFQKQSTVLSLLARTIHGQVRRAGKGDGTVEEPGAAGRGEVRVHVGGARAVPDDRDLVGCAAEAGDVLLHPLQCQLLVGDAVISAHSTGVHLSEFPESEVPKDIESVVHGNDDHLFFAHNVLDLGIACVALVVAPAIDPDQDWQAFFFLEEVHPWGEDVEVQAILALARPAALVANGPILRRAQDLGCPARSSCRWLPAPLADRRLAEGDAPKGGHAALPRALRHAATQGRPGRALRFVARPTELADGLTNRGRSTNGGAS
mmetsp:Transcript_133057/g.332105  ORF Transcript_133057/g.332105 Transcript_133057/m.332105 type:complete len:453 (-) Transcript_133057:164-1522(-)